MIKSIKSFLAKSRPPHFGHDDSKDTYSVNFVLFQVCLQDKHFILGSLIEYYKSEVINV